MRGGCRWNHLLSPNTGTVAPPFTCAQYGKELGKEWRAMSDAQKNKYK